MYKVFNISELNVLETNRWTGDSNTVRRSNDGQEFITQLRTGVELLEVDSPVLTEEEAKELMLTTNWFSEESFDF